LSCNHQDVAKMFVDFINVLESEKSDLARQSSCHSPDETEEKNEKQFHERDNFRKYNRLPRITKYNSTDRYPIWQVFKKPGNSIFEHKHNYKI